MAVVLVVRNGQQPAAGTLQTVDRFRRGWTEYFRRATDNRGTFIATLDGGPEDSEPPDDDDDGGGCGILAPASRPPAGGTGRAIGSALLGLFVAFGLAAASRRPRRAPG